MWLNDLLSDSRDIVSLFDHTSRASLAPPTTADSATLSQWLARDATARLALRNHLPLAERAHFGQHKTAKALYDAVVARYSSPATAALGRLILPYLFPELSAFATVEDLVTHLRTSDARYRAALPAEFLDRNPPTMHITLYFILTRLPDSLRAVRDHFLALDPTDLTDNLLEQHILAAKTSVVAVGAARGTPRTPFFEGCSPSPLAPSYASAAAVDILARERVARVVAVAAGVVVVEAVEVVEVAEVVAAVGVVAGVGASVAVVVAEMGVAVVVVVGVVAIGVELFRGEDLAVARGGSSSVGARPLRPSSFVSGLLSVGRLGTRLSAEFGDEAKRPRWAELFRSGVDVFTLDYNAILAPMYALSVSAEGDCYWCVPPDPDIEAAALGASESALPGTAPTEALHTFTLDLGASRYFFRDSTTLTPLSAPVPVRLVDPFGGPVLARSSTVLPCLAVPSGSLSGLHLPSFSTNLVSTAALQDAMVTTTTPGGQRVSICTCTWTGRHLATFTHRPGSSMYTLTTKPPQVAASAQVSASGPVAPPLLVPPPVEPDPPVAPPLLSPLPATPSWHALPPPCFWSSQVYTSPPALASLALPSLYRGAAVRCSSLLLVSPDESSRVGSSPHSLQLRERFREDLPNLRLQSKRGGQFSSVVLRDFFRGEGILQSFSLLASPQQNGIAERRIGLVMEVARTFIIHAGAPHFLWPFAVRYAAHQLNLWPCVSLPETLPTLRWTGKVGDASVFRVWGSHAFVCDASADKLPSRAVPCIFLGFPPDAPGWQFYHPTSRRVLSSQDVTFDELVPFYRLFPYRTAPLPPPPLFLAPGPPPVDPLPPHDPTPSNSGAARGVASGGAASGGAEPTGAEPGGAESVGAESGGAEPGGAEPGGAEPEGAEPGGAELASAEPGGAEPGGT
ncbi:unnamed protein product [Closterium sp. NIES-54]